MAGSYTRCLYSRVFAVPILDCISLGGVHTYLGPQRRAVRPVAAPLALAPRIAQRDQLEVALGKQAQQRVRVALVDAIALLRAGKGGGRSSDNKMRTIVNVSGETQF